PLGFPLLWPPECNGNRRGPKQLLKITLHGIPVILKADESPRAVLLHAGVNDTTQRQTETLKRDFRSLIEKVRSTTPAATIIVSGPLPTYRRGHERLFRADGLHPSRVGAELLSDNISRTLRSI
uniref:SGNH hydrolase-type esterase domain-containing protein n=1 Tax=Cyprinus carpio carpio TaxID=630221 RepID=A0A9J8C430_CYPCA